MASHLLGAEGLHLEYPTRGLFDSVTLGIEEGDRIGVVGRNGDGKPSLLGLLSGWIDPWAGRVTRRSGGWRRVLGQHDDFNLGESVVPRAARTVCAPHCTLRHASAAALPPNRVGGHRAPYGQGGGG